MAAAQTYTPISSTTFSSNTTSLTFNSFGSSYTDLIIIISGAFTSDISGGMTFNGDSGSNYSRTRLYGNGSTATTNSSNSGTQLSFTTGTGNAQSTFIINIMNYSNASTYKTVITRASMDIPSMSTGIWMSTAAITSINLTANSSGQFVAGTTITLYGIKAA